MMLLEKNKDNIQISPKGVNIPGTYREGRRVIAPD
jgi:hypothetical protein